MMGREAKRFVNSIQGFAIGDIASSELLKIGIQYFLVSYAGRHSHFIIVNNLGGKIKNAHQVVPVIKTKTGKPTTELSISLKSNH